MFWCAWKNTCRDFATCDKIPWFHKVFCFAGSARNRHSSFSFECHDIQYINIIQIITILSYIYMTYGGYVLLSRNYPCGLSLLWWNKVSKIKHLRLPAVNLTDRPTLQIGLEPSVKLKLLLLPAPDVIDTSLLWDCCSAQLVQSAEKVSASQQNSQQHWQSGRLAGWLGDTQIQGWNVFSCTFDRCLIYGSYTVWRTEPGHMQSIFEWSICSLSKWLW